MRRLYTVAGVRYIADCVETRSLRTAVSRSSTRDALERSVANKRGRVDEQTQVICAVGQECPYASNGRLPTIRSDETSSSCPLRGF